VICGEIFFFNIFIFRYTLKCITYGNGGHFICTLKFGNMWYMYDGVYNNRSANECLKPQSTPSPPRGYHRDYAIYLRDGLNKKPVCHCVLYSKDLNLFN
jgi:hypothetical protein